METAAPVANTDLPDIDMPVNTETPMNTDTPTPSDGPDGPSATPTPAPNQCQVEFMPWDVLFSGGKKTVVEDGSLEATVEHYAVGDCPTFYYAPTGGNVGGRTALSYNISMASSSGEPDKCCQLRTDGGVSEFVSFQAIVVKTSGWTMQPRGLRIMDVDAHQAAGGDPDGPSSWREVAGVFGMHGDQLVAPTVTINDEAVLEAGESTLPASVAPDIGLPGAELSFPTVRFKSNTFHDCPWDDPARCESKFDFGAPIDTLVVLIAITEKALNAPFGLGGVLIDKIVSDCGCRCKLVDGGTRILHVPVPGSPGECTRKSTTGAYTKCDEEGVNWCETKNVLGWVCTGPQMTNGNYPCESSPRVMCKYLHQYDP